MEDERVKRLFEAALAEGMPSRHSGRRVVVLCYHSVHPTKEIRSATPAVFEQQVRWLRRHCELVPFGSIASRARIASTDGKPIVAVTFDDGYDDNYTYAFPILKAYEVPAVVFVTTGLVDRDPDVIRRFASAWRVPDDEVTALSWGQISEMHAAGVAIGAHTRTHPVLATMKAAAAMDEIATSKAALEERLGTAVELFAYPFGKPRAHVTRETRDLVASAGFTSAATILYRGVRFSDDPLMIPRFPVTKDSMEIFSGKVLGRLDAVGAWQTLAPEWAARLISRDQPGVVADDLRTAPPAAGTVSIKRMTDPNDQVALPWSRSPRWIVPRQPADQARAALAIHHPVTFRSRAGWELARAMAVRGAFGSLPRYPFAPREVWEAVGSLIPPGGSLATASANHPGRFLVLVLDAHARPLFFAKVARDSVGAHALLVEGDALAEFGPILPPPLMAPMPVRRSDGVLVFDAVDWRPRLIPWRLPREVAFAFGSFFKGTRLGGEESGAAHGDLAPWNLLRTEAGWAIVDWEGFLREAPPYYDVFHYLVQSMTSGIRKPRARTIADGVRGKGWIADVIRAYAAGAGVDVKDSTHYLHEYLRISRRRLDTVRRRGLALRARLGDALR